MARLFGGKGIIYIAIDRTIGVENIRKFREDLKEIVIEKSVRFQRWNPDPMEAKADALDAANKARSSKWDKVAFLFGAAGTLLFFLPVIPLVASFVGLFISLVTAIRRIAVDILIYEDPYQFRHPNNVKFAVAWNRAMNGLTSLLLIPMGVLIRMWSQEYITTLWIMTDYLEEL